MPLGIAEEVLVKPMDSANIAGNYLEMKPRREDGAPESTQSPLTLDQTEWLPRNLIQAVSEVRNEQ